MALRIGPFISPTSSNLPAPSLSSRLLSLRGTPLALLFPPSTHPSNLSFPLLPEFHTFSICFLSQSLASALSALLVVDSLSLSVVLSLFYFSFPILFPSTHPHLLLLLQICCPNPSFFLVVPTMHVFNLMRS
jgi:hypothetical protein